MATSWAVSHKASAPHLGMQLKKALFPIEGFKEQCHWPVLARAAQILFVAIEYVKGHTMFMRFCFCG